MASLLFLSLSVTKPPHPVITIIIITTTNSNPDNPTILKSHSLINPFPIHPSILFYPLPMPLLINSFIIFSPRFRRRITPVANHRKNDSIASTVKKERLSFLEKICFTLTCFWLKLSCVQASESSQLVSFFFSFWSYILFPIRSPAVPPPQFLLTAGGTATPWETMRLFPPRLLRTRVFAAGCQSEFLAAGQYINWWLDLVTIPKKWLN